jgi:uncharacterized glyoxalase superfamily protein PhnB
LIAGRARFFHFSIYAIPWRGKMPFRSGKPSIGKEHLVATKSIPEGYQTITPSLIVREARKAIDFYKKAFGAEEIMAMSGPGGSIMHAELKIGTSRVMLADEMPQFGCKSPAAYGGTPVSFYVYVDNVDNAWKRATDAGAKPVMPVGDMFWGDRVGKVDDPFGHGWTLAQHVKDLTPDQIAKGQKEWMEKMSKKQ